MHRLAENLYVRLEGDDGAATVGGAGLLQFSRSVPAREPHAPTAPLAVYLHIHPLGQRVDDRGADAMQPARSVVDLAAELSAGVQRGHDHLQRRFVFELWVRIYR